MHEHMQAQNAFLYESWAYECYNVHVHEPMHAQMIENYVNVHMHESMLK